MKISGCHENQIKYLNALKSKKLMAGIFDDRFNKYFWQGHSFKFITDSHYMNGSNSDYHDYKIK